MCMNPANKNLEITDRLVKQGCEWEGFRPVAELDTLAVPPVWTIGYGDTYRDARTRPQPITEAQAREDLAIRYGEMAKLVKAVVKVPLTVGKLEALSSFADNLGVDALEKSHLLVFLNAGQYELASAEFPKWCHAGGVVLPGLASRRALERQWFDEAETATA